VKQWIDPNGGIGDDFANFEYYRDPSRPNDQHNIHYVNNGMSFRSPGVVNSFAKRATPMNRYPRPFGTLYLACYTDDPTQVASSGLYYTGATDWHIATYYDMHHIENVTGTMPGSLQYSQRIAPKRHGTGCNGVYLDGHARILKADEVADYNLWDDGDYRTLDTGWPRTWR
jgi:prepilin-type processing-associated H-X9-DG protein